MDPDVRLYERPLAAGAGTQVVRVVNGTITHQWLQASEGYALDSSHGNPEWVGQPGRVMRGRGFKRVRGARRAQLLGLTLEE